ncbi:hypothetical protein ABRT01_10105 [Lentibacillus sp. L22]|uniref:hypothetical protein n=1 Tax=Lentibacillus TaxID=175304 RepID=UPI0022B1C647|nr:hypothetical protein [Lentibacillus daqui]
MQEHQPIRSIIDLGTWVSTGFAVLSTSVPEHQPNSYNIDHGHIQYEMQNSPFP